jgi:signal transduction histidine kinase
MSVPLRTRDRTIGAITLLSAESGRHFDANDLPLAEELARRCALALENATLLRQAQAAEQDLRRMNEDLERRVAERTTELKRAKERVEEANARLKEMDTMKDDFLGALSYQLASPINAVLGYSDLLLEGAGGALREDQRRYIRRITGSSRVLLSLVHDLLDMSRMSAGKFQLERDPIDLCDSVREVLGFLEPLTEMQGLRVVSRLSDDPAEVQADPQRIEQVLATLLHSAMQLTPSGGLLRAAVERSGGRIRFELYHTGATLSVADIAQIFRRFTRLGGAWLGLSIARSIVEAHGGSMGVETNAGDGNTFWFTLPASEPARAQ